MHIGVFPPSCRNGTSALAVGKKAACPGCNPPPLPQARGRLVLPGHGPACPVRSRTRPVRGGEGGHFPPFGGLGGRAPLRGVGRGHSPLPGGAGDASPAASPENGQLLPAARRADNVGFPCILACSRPAAGTELPLLPQARGRLARGATSRPCRRQEAGLSCPATGRLVLPGHGLPFSKRAKGSTMEADFPGVSPGRNIREEQPCIH